MMLRTFIYISELAPSCSPSEVGHILKLARTNNAIHGETGVLLFDGERFAQRVEGEPQALGRLLSNLLQDPRHRQLRILCDMNTATRRYESFQMGYAACEEPAAMARLAQSQGEAAIDAFDALVACADLTP